jgi:hypothetical protein
MNTSKLLAIAGAGLAATRTQAAETPAVSRLVAEIQSADDAVRGPAWQKAGPAGAPAVGPLAALLTHADFEIARSARRALYQIVRYAGRPGAAKEAAAVERALLAALAAERSSAARRHLLWMLSEIGGDGAVAPIAALLEDVELREDARCVLQQIPGGKPIAALKKALAKAPADFQPALADALRARGQKIGGHPTRKLTPAKPTSVKAEAGAPA